MVVKNENNKKPSAVRKLQKGRKTRDQCWQGVLHSDPHHQQ